ncbi:MAG: hypothetical protein NDI77_05160 [Geobacteraceae bacterium]|nr:hypothetical protein [Geobacteraceae bacterium]
MNLFETFDPAVKNIILGVLDIEQEHISMERPRVKEHIDEIVTSAAKKEVEKLEAEERP